ncbi:hypothetical protein [Rhizobium sp. LC145]|uniref:hypothetical protein n=1 Tax=Rhizobium sp. LC145 TaxID=1120688 RepID=UPI000629E3C4|nr:hypothetical protein [Rhizobium sp. LC145]KKX30346.1 hypothetical protein YH62_12420 [Rhizobium sp. LC145]TKT56778.1 hypothetical protein FDR95_14940 [Rhizobiaceae bacterium LC148]
MRDIRRIIGDAMSGGVLAALIVVMLTMQGAIGAYAQASMASAETDPVLVICATHGTETLPQKHSPDASWPDCCSAACQIACTIGHGFPPESFVLNNYRPHAAHHSFETVFADLAPRALGLTGEARAPPPFSI